MKKKALFFMAILSVATLVAGCTGGAAVADRGASGITGLSTRPEMTETLAAKYSMTQVFAKTGERFAEKADPWDPTQDAFMAGKVQVAPDYTVDAGLRTETATAFRSIQKAVNRACLDAMAGNRTKRIYISVAPGTYAEVVYIPGEANTTSSEANFDAVAFIVPPITIYGTGPKMTDTRIVYNLDANVTAKTPPPAGLAKNYTDQLNALFDYANTSNKATFSGIWKIYNSIATRASNIGTGQTAIVLSRNLGFQLKNLTIENSFNENFEAGKGYTAVRANSGGANEQAVALELDGTDKAHIEAVRLIGNQDTLYIKTLTVGTTARNFLRNCYVEGDVDFIFGRATAFFSKCEIRWLGERGTIDGWITAPSTNYGTSYGFVFDDCDFTSDGAGIAGKAGVYLGRQWFESISMSPYSKTAEGNAVILGTTWNASGLRNNTNIPMYVYEAVGKVVVMNSRIGSHINAKSPWASWNDPDTAYFRPCQLDSQGYWENLQAVLVKNAGANGTTTMKTLYPGGSKNPVEPFLAEYKNITK